MQKFPHYVDNTYKIQPKTCTHCFGENDAPMIYVSSCCFHSFIASTFFYIIHFRLDFHFLFTECMALGAYFRFLGYFVLISNLYLSDWFYYIRLFEFLFKVHLRVWARFAFFLRFYSFSMLLLCVFFIPFIRSYSIFIHRVRSISSWCVCCFFVVARSMHTACSWEQCVFFAISSIEWRDKYDETWNICEKSFIPLFFCRMHSCKYFFVIVVVGFSLLVSLWFNNSQALVWYTVHVQSERCDFFYNYSLPADVVLTNATR